jgi:hypothetical protein
MGIKRFEQIDMSEGLFSFKPLGDINQAKKDSLSSMRNFLKNYLNMSDVDSLDDNQVLKKVKDMSFWAKSPGASKLNILANDLYRIAKPLFENKIQRIYEAVMTVTISKIYQAKNEESIQLQNQLQSKLDSMKNTPVGFLAEFAKQSANLLELLDADIESRDK